MMTKEDFCKAIDAIKKIEATLDKFNELKCNLFETDLSYYGVLMDILFRQSFNMDQIDNIYWWLYESEDGEGMYMNGKPIDLSTSEKLYDFLISLNNESRS